MTTSALPCTSYAARSSASEHPPATNRMTRPPVWVDFFLLLAPYRLCVCRADRTTGSFSAVVADTSPFTHAKSAPDSLPSTNCSVTSLSGHTYRLDEYSLSSEAATAAAFGSRLPMPKNFFFSLC